MVQARGLSAAVLEMSQSFSGHETLSLVGEPGIYTMKQVPFIWLSAKGTPRGSTQPQGGEEQQGLGMLPRRGDSSPGGRGSQVSKADCSSSNQKSGAGLVPEAHCWSGCLALVQAFSRTAFLHVRS